MPLFSWKPEYSVNEATLDSHHQHLFSVLNSVYGTVMNSTEMESVLPKIDILTEYTMHHFSAEEEFMIKIGFTDIDNHIVKHREFARSVESLRASYHNNDLEAARSLIIVLGEWLLQHVLREDQKYSGYPLPNAE